MKRCRLSGFTVIELLVASSITVLLAGMIMGVVMNLSRVWARSTYRLSTEAQARRVLDQLTVDLQGALFREDGGVWLSAVHRRTIDPGDTLWQDDDQAPARAKPTALSYQVNTPHLADARFGVTGGWLSFFTTARGSQEAEALESLSTPVAVSYQIVRRGVSTGPQAKRRYLLHRAQVRPGGNASRLGVIECGYDITAPAYMGTAASSGETILGDPCTIRFPTLDSVIADHVIDFGVRLYVRVQDTEGEATMRLIFPAGSDGELNPDDLSHSGTQRSGAVDAENYPQQFPDVVEILVRVLTPEGAELIEGYESRQQRVFAPAGVDAGRYWWDLALAHSRVFTRRIVLRR